MKKNVSSTTASTEASIFGVATSVRHEALSWISTSCTRRCGRLSVARANDSAAWLAWCTGWVIALSRGASVRSCLGACCTHSLAGP